MNDMKALAERSMNEVLTTTGSNLTHAATKDIVSFLEDRVNQFDTQMIINRRTGNALF